LLAHCLAASALSLGVLSRRSLRRFLVETPTLEFPENTLSLHPFLENP
jgi:hypothetical protein